MKNYSSFGLALRILRISKGLSQEELAARLGMNSNTHISRLESGAQTPNLDMVFRLAEALEVKASQIITMMEEQKQK